MNQIIRDTCNTLKEFNAVLQQLSVEQFTRPLAIFSGSSIGMHACHVIEFYQCLFAQSIETEGVNYDQRKRDQQLRSDLQYFEVVTHRIIRRLENLSEAQLAKPMRFFCDETQLNDVPTQSSFARELQYNFEHIIHHAAIIKIGILTVEPTCVVPSNFGVAPSTVRNR